MPDEQSKCDLERIQEILEQRLHELSTENPSVFTNSLQEILDAVRNLPTLSS